MCKYLGLKEQSVSDWKGFEGKASQAMKYLQPKLADRVSVYVDHAIIVYAEGSHQMVSQSFLEASDDAGLVSSIYSTPNSSKALAILILVFISKNALAN